jgi:hypothetical protein
MSLFGSIGHFLSNAAKTAGKALHSATHAVEKATGAVANLAGKIPVIGPGLHGVLDVTIASPWALADSVASGRRIDKAVLDHLKRQVSDVKEVAPYAQTVISVVPGVGQGVSGVIGASLALAQGKPITEAVKNGVLDAMPGGSAARSVAEVGMGVMRGARIDHIAMAAIPLPDEQKKMLTGALNVVYDVANKRPVNAEMVQNLLQTIPGGGQAVVNFAKKNNIPVPVAAAEAVMKTLPPQLHSAVKIGIALGHAKSLQAITQRALPHAIPQLEKLGLDHVKATPDLQPLAKTLADPSGFYIGTALMQRSGVTPAVLMKVRKGLQAGPQRKGFDLALAAHIGKVTSPKREGTPTQLAGYYTTRGMRTASPQQKRGMLKTIAKNPDMKKGALVAASEIKDIGWWGHVKRYFGFKAV